MAGYDAVRVVPGPVVAVVPAVFAPAAVIVGTWITEGINISTAGAFCCVRDSPVFEFTVNRGGPAFMRAMGARGYTVFAGPSSAGFMYRMRYFPLCQ